MLRFRASLPWVLVCASLPVVIAAGAIPPAQAPAKPLTADALFQTSKVWTVQLTMSKEAWTSLTPLPPPAPAGPPPPPPTGGFISPPGFRNGISGLKGLDFQYVHAALDFDSRHFADVAVRLKGNGTYTSGQRFNKPSLKIDLNKFVKGQTLAGVTTINLHNSITDASWMNEVLAYRLYRDAGVPAPRTAYAQVYLTVAGSKEKTYLGLYSLVENVDEDFARSRAGLAGSAVLKPVTTTLFTDLGKDWKAYNQIYDPKTPLKPADRQRVIELADLVSNATDSVYATRFREFVDLNAFAKYMAVVVWLANTDSLLEQGQNYYTLLHPTTRAVAFVPWDQDHSFGQFVPYVPAEKQQQLDIVHPWMRPFDGAPFAIDVPNRFLERAFALDAFKTQYLAEISRLRKTVAAPDRLTKQVDELAAMLAPIVAKEPTPVLAAAFQQSLGTAPFPRPISPTVTVVPIKTFLRLRDASVAAQLKTLGVQ
jgi:spore coat protein H